MIYGLVHAYKLARADHFLLMEWAFIYCNALFFQCTTYLKLGSVLSCRPF
jgi:hypothetical protein